MYMTKGFLSFKSQAFLLGCWQTLALRIHIKFDLLKNNVAMIICDLPGVFAFVLANFPQFFYNEATSLLDSE